MKKHKCCKTAEYEIKYDSLFHPNEWSMQIGIGLCKIEFCPFCGKELSKTVKDV